MNTELKVGDIVTSYYKGYWRITKIEKRYYNKYEEDLGYGKLGEEYGSLVSLKLLADSNCNPPKKTARTEQCDILYCNLVTLDKLEKLKIEYCKNIDKVIGLL